jgi:hypothetical protein
MDARIINTCFLSCNSTTRPLAPIRKNITQGSSQPVESLDNRIGERVIDSDRWLCLLKYNGFIA